MAVKKGVVSSDKYTFDADAKKITFHSDYTGIALSDIMYITNVKKGVNTVIYDPSVDTKGGEFTSALELTLDFDTTDMDDSDPLQIIVGMSLLDGSATEEKQDDFITGQDAQLANEFEIITKLTSIFNKIITAPATEATAASILAKISAAPSTEAKQDIIIAALASIDSTDFATDAVLTSFKNITGGQLDAIVNKLIAAPATEAKQDALIAKDFATEATLSTLNAKIPIGSSAAAASISVVPAVSTTFSISGNVGEADGANVALGAIADGAVTTNAPGTISAKLRGIIAILLNFIGAGQKTMAQSSPVVIASDQSTVPVTANAGTNLNTSALLTQTDFDTKIGDVAETAPASDTASSGLNGRLQRIAQRITSFIAQIPAALTAGGNFKVAVEEALPAGTNLLGKTGIDQTTDGTTNKVRATGTLKQSFGAHTTLTVTALNSLASHATNGWQSDRIDNTSTRATDYMVLFEITMPNLAPGSDKAVYLFVAPWYYDGSAWHVASQGTATALTGTQGTTTIAEPNNLIPINPLNFTTANSVISGIFFLKNVFGDNIPDGFSFVVKNFSGQTISSSGNMVAIKAINEILA